MKQHFAVTQTDVCPSFLGLLLFVFQMKAQFGQPRVLKALLMCCVSPFPLQRKKHSQNMWLPELGVPFETQKGIGQTKKRRNIARTLSSPTLLVFPKKRRRVFNKNNIPVHFKAGNTETEVGPQSDVGHAVQHSVNAQTCTLEQTNNLSTSA